MTDADISTDVKPLQPENAPLPITVTDSGIIVFLHPAISLFVDFSIIALHPFLESYTGFPGSTSILVKPLQPENADPKILVTDAGISTDVKPLQLRNAYPKILVTDAGISTEVKPLQPRNA